MTGNVSQGRNCEYVITLYNPISLTSTNINTYEITVDVEYVDSDTYLGVYKYTKDTRYTELIREVVAGFTGSIQTTVDIHCKVFVQMYPNSTSSSAIFNISSRKINSDKISGGKIAGLIASAILVIVILVVINALCIYHRSALKK